MKAQRMIPATIISLMEVVSRSRGLDLVVCSASTDVKLCS
jgi:hypothetical protein